MKRVLLVQPSLQPPGGGNAVAVWILEALKHDYEVSVLSWERLDLDSINRYFGTSLTSKDFRSYLPHPAWRVIDVLPVPASHLKASVLLRLCKRMNDAYDVILTANNEADFGRPGIQYVHYPWAHVPRPDWDLEWYHGSPFVVQAYYRLCAGISGFSFKRARENLTLVNSDWTGGKVKECHGIGSLTVYPPIAGAFPTIPWDRRENAFVAINRISQEKGLDKIVEILARVRAIGHDVHLHLVGSRDDPRYYEQIRRIVESNASWVSLEIDLSRRELIDLVARHRYGIHAMEGEHFGMAVAEMVRAGCIVFTPRTGGQTEITGNDKRLQYQTPAEAAEKIARTISRPEEQLALRSSLEARRDLFSVQHFTERIREIVRDAGDNAPSRNLAAPPARRFL